MDINQQLQPIVTSLIDNLKGSIEEQLKSQINEEVIKRIANSEINTTVDQLVAVQIEQRLNRFDFVNASSEQLTLKVASLTDQINNSLVATANTQITNYISQKIAAIDFNQMVGDLITRKLSAMLDARNFPPQSIPQSSIDFNGLKLSGDHIIGGIIDQFGSTGIEDRSTHVQMTLMDHAVAFEGPVWTPNLLVKGNVAIEGTLTLNGDIDTTTTAYTKLIEDTGLAVKKSLNTALFDSYSEVIFNKIKQEGLDLDQITQNGKNVIKGNQLGYHVIDSNLQRVGLVRDLQTQGESYLSQTLYVTGHRVGINTIEPNAALSVWDEEIELNFNKRSENTAQIVTPRNQSLVLGANNKQNLTLNVDGSVSIENLNLKNISMSSGVDTPNYGGTKGHIVWNESPANGSSIGWVCLGGTRWAKFGKIE